MRRLNGYGHFITALSLTQSEFLHPQALNPFAEHCVNLKSLAIYNCSPISDEMFVGELPELTKEPFAGLEVSNPKTIRAELNSFQPRIIFPLIYDLSKVLYTITVYKIKFFDGMRLGFLWILG